MATSKKRFRFGEGGNARLRRKLSKARRRGVKSFLKLRKSGKT